MKSKIFRQISDVFSSYNVELADIFGHVTMQEIFIVFLVLERNDDNLLKFRALCLNSQAPGRTYTSIGHVFRLSRPRSGRYPKTMKNNPP